MKKIISMIGLLCISIAILSGCSTEQNNFTEKNYTADSSQIQTINIDAIDRKIDIELSDDNQILIIMKVNKNFLTLQFLMTIPLPCHTILKSNGQIILALALPCRIVPSAYAFLKIYYLH